MKNKNIYKNAGVVAVLSLFISLSFLPAISGNTVDSNKNINDLSKKIDDELDMVDVKMRLEEMAADEAGHARELRRILKGL